MNRTNKLIKLAILLSFAIVLSYFESLIPLPIPFPGIRLGLANSIGLIILYMGSKKDYLLFNLFKVFIMAILRNGFGTAFLIGLSGMILSVSFTLLIYKMNKASIFGLSFVGAIFHSLGQMIMVSIIYNNIYLVNYLPILITFSIITGFLTAFIAVLVINRLPDRLLRIDS